MDEGLNALVFRSNESRRPDREVVFRARPRGTGGERATVSNENSGGQIGNSFHEELLVGTTGRRGRVGVNRVNKMEAIGFTIIQMLLRGPGTLLW